MTNRKPLNKVHQPIKRLYTVRESAYFLGRSYYSMLQLIKSAKIPVVQDGKKMWLEVQDLDEWIEKNKTRTI